MKKILSNIIGIITVVLLVVMLFQINVINNRIGTLTGDVIAEYENTYDIDGSPVLGNINKAKVIIVEFTDFQCPYCSRGHDTLNTIINKYGDDIAVVYKSFPLSFHQYAQTAAEASMCAYDQDEEMFWEYYDTLFANQASFSDSYFSTVAEQLGLDVNDFNSCLESGKYTAKVQEDFNYGAELGVTGTPAFFVNGELIVGAQPESVFDAEIEKWI